MTPELQRIVTDLHRGLSAHPPQKLVYNKAGDVLQVINALWAETQRADRAEAKLAAQESDTDVLETNGK